MKKYTLHQPTQKPNSHVLRMAGSILAALAAIPLALTAQTPTQASPAPLTTDQQVIQQDAPETPGAIALRSPILYSGAPVVSTGIQVSMTDDEAGSDLFTEAVEAAPGRGGGDQPLIILSPKVATALLRPAAAKPTIPTTQNTPQTSDKPKVAIITKDDTKPEKPKPVVSSPTESKTPDVPVVAPPSPSPSPAPSPAPTPPPSTSTPPANPASGSGQQPAPTPAPTPAPAPSPTPAPTPDPTPSPSPAPTTGGGSTPPADTTPQPAETTTPVATSPSNDTKPADPTQPAKLPEVLSNILS